MNEVSIETLSELTFMYDKVIANDGQYYVEDTTSQFKVGKDNILGLVNELLFYRTGELIGALIGDSNITLTNEELFEYITKIKEVKQFYKGEINTLILNKHLQ